jgi:hypothetical protein
MNIVSFNQTLTPVSVEGPSLSDYALRKIIKFVNDSGGSSCWRALRLFSIKSEEWILV